MYYDNLDEAMNAYKEFASKDERGYCRTLAALAEIDSCLPVTDENKEAISLILDRSTEVWEFGGYPTISSYAGFLANAYAEEAITLEDIKQCSIADIMNDFKLEEIHNITSWKEKNKDCEIMN